MEFWLTHLPLENLGFTCILFLNKSVKGCLFEANFYRLFLLLPTASFLFLMVDMRQRTALAGWFAGFLNIIVISLFELLSSCLSTATSETYLPRVNS